jgi:two-component system NtrC family sensor kinase
MAGETVLIIEDRRENIVHLANNVLKPKGYRVITAMDGQRGLQRILSDRPDLIILDLNMPKMDGLEVLATLQEQQVDIPVILTTFYGSEQVAQQALQLGAADYVVKPFSAGEMLDAVERALAQRVQRSASPEPAETIPLTRQVERWMRDMNILTRVGKALVAQLDLESVCSRTVEAAIYLTRADHAFLFLMEDSDKTRLRLRAARGTRDQQVRLLDQPVETGLAVQVATSGKIVLQTRPLSDQMLVELAASPLGPPIATPLRWQQKTLGVLVVARRFGEHPFGETEVEWLGGLADYAAIAVRNAWAFQQPTPPQPLPESDLSEAAVWRQEIKRLIKELQAATETVRRLAALLAEEKSR